MNPFIRQVFNFGDKTYLVQTTPLNRYTFRQYRESKPTLSALVVSGAALNFVGHGTMHGYPAVLFAHINSNSIGLTLSDHDRSWIASIVALTSVIGILICPILVYRFGRQKVHLLTTAPALLGWVLFALVESVPLFLAARLLHGLALGLRTPIAAVLVAEYTDPKYRGAFIGSFAISLALGIFLSHLCGSYFSWKHTASLCGIFPLVTMIIIFFSPESPSWLASKGRFDEAITSFRWLRGTSSEQEKELTVLIKSQKVQIELDLKEKSESNNKDRSWKSFLKPLKSYLKVFRKREVIKPAVVAVSMLTIFEFCGSHYIPAFGNVILLSVLNKQQLNEVNWHFTLLDFLRMVSAFLAIFLLKYFKRRTILFGSGIMTVLSMISISFYMYARDFYKLSWLGMKDFLPMGLMVLQTLSFSLGLVPLNWVICGEIFPLAYRNIGSTIAATFLPFVFLLCMKTIPYLFSAIGIEGSFLLYAVILIVCLCIMYILLPETKDRTLHDIEKSFESRKKRRENDFEAEITLMSTDENSNNR